MAKGIKPEKLSEQLKTYLEEYVEDITEGVEKETDSVTKEAVKEIKSTSPKGYGKRKTPYYKGWTRQKGKERKGRFIVKIHNKTNYQLTHLLEFGHATRNGGTTKAQPHIRPLEEKYNQIYEDRITTVIRRRSKK